MAGELPQCLWYAVPNPLPTSPDVSDIHGACRVTNEALKSSFSCCYAHHVDSYDNNAGIRLARCINPSTASEDAAMMLSNEAGGPDCVLPAIDPAACLEGSGESDPMSNTITNAIQLLGGNRTSSYSSRMMWDENDELTVEQAYAAAGVRASAIPAAGNSYSSSTPRASTAATICPPAPVRPRPSIRLVTAADLGMLVSAQ